MEYYVKIGEGGYCDLYVNDPLPANPDVFVGRLSDGKSSNAALRAEKIGVGEVYAVGRFEKNSPSRISDVLGTVKVGEKREGKKSVEYEAYYKELKRSKKPVSLSKSEAKAKAETKNKEAGVESGSIKEKLNFNFIENAFIAKGGYGGGKVTTAKKHELSEEGKLAKENKPITIVPGTVLCKGAIIKLLRPYYVKFSSQKNNCWVLKTGKEILGFVSNDEKESVTKVAAEQKFDSNKVYYRWGDTAAKLELKEISKDKNGRPVYKVTKASITKFVKEEKVASSAGKHEQVETGGVELNKDNIRETNKTKSGFEECIVQHSSELREKKFGLDCVEGNKNAWVILSQGTGIAYGTIFSDLNNPKGIILDENTKPKEDKTYYYASITSTYEFKLKYNSGDGYYDVYDLKLIGGAPVGSAPPAPAAPAAPPAPAAPAASYAPPAPNNTHLDSIAKGFKLNHVTPPVEKGGDKLGKVLGTNEQPAHAATKAPAANAPKPAANAPAAKPAEVKADVPAAANAPKPVAPEAGNKLPPPPLPEDKILPPPPVQEQKKSEEHQQLPPPPPPAKKLSPPPAPAAANVSGEVRSIEIGHVMPEVKGCADVTTRYNNLVEKLGEEADSGDKKIYAGETLTDLQNKIKTLCINAFNKNHEDKKSKKDHEAKVKRRQEAAEARIEAYKNAESNDEAAKEWKALEVIYNSELDDIERELGSSLKRLAHSGKKKLKGLFNKGVSLLGLGSLHKKTVNACFQKAGKYFAKHNEDFKLSDLCNKFKDMKSATEWNEKVKDVLNDTFMNSVTDKKTASFMAVLYSMVALEDSKFIIEAEIGFSDGIATSSEDNIKFNDDKKISIKDIKSLCKNIGSSASNRKKLGSTIGAFVKGNDLSFSVSDFSLIKIKLGLSDILF